MDAILYPYQRAATEFMKKNNRCGLFLDMGLGKATDNNTPILKIVNQRPYETTVGQIKVGDKIYDRKGEPTTVLATYLHKNKKAYKVTLKDGRSFICCDEHLIPYYRYNATKKISHKRLIDILKDYKPNSVNPSSYKYNIPQNEAVEFEEQSHEIDPYTFGTTCHTQNTNIPQEYIYDSIDNRISLLKGILSHTTDVKFQCYVHRTTNNKLAEQIKTICQSLGFGVYVDKSDGLNNIKIYTSEKLVNTPIQVDPPRNKSKMNPIVDIQEVEPRDMSCFTVDNDEQLYLINDYIVTHNTLVALTGLTELAQEGKLHGHILVIAPKRIAINTWPDEITKWSHTKNARFVMLSGLTKKKRDALLDEVETSKPTIYIINRELVPQLVKRFPGKTFPFLNVVIDEAQSFKGYASVGFKALKSIAPYTHRWIELTGTPSPNGLIDIWSLIYLLDGGQRLGRNITQYRETFFYPGRCTPEGYPYEWLLKEYAEERIHNQIKDVAISMTKEDHLDMPDLTHNMIELEMTNKERKIYDQLKKDKILPLIDGSAIEASNAAVLHGILQQLANGAIYTDETHKDIIELHKHKLDALDEIIDGSNGQPILCFYWYKHDILRLTNRFKDAEVFTGKPEQLKRWNNKEIPLLLAQPMSAGHGLNFQHGGHILVFFSIPNSLELYEQSIARLYRNGQTEAVIVHYLKMKGAIENQIIANLMDKKLTQDALIEAVKANIEDIL